jgi:hypothetical protein
MLEVGFNTAVLLAHMKRQEDACNVWLPMRGQPLDQTPEHYRQWIATLGNATAG